jgi:hypothetical protein
MHSRPIHTPSTGTLPIAQVMMSLQIPESVRGCPGPGEMTIDRNRLALYISCELDQAISRAIHGLDSSPTLFDLPRPRGR